MNFFGILYHRSAEKPHSKNLLSAIVHAITVARTRSLAGTPLWKASQTSQTWLSKSRATREIETLRSLLGIDRVEYQNRFAVI